MLIKFVLVFHFFLLSVLFVFDAYIWPTQEKVQVESYFEACV